MGLEDYPGLMRRCDRCDKALSVEELREQAYQENLYVCDRCYDERGFNEIKAES